MRLTGKVALVTGATQGIGMHIVRRLAEEGASVAFTGRSRDKGEVVERALRNDGLTVTYIQSDVSIEEQVRASVDETASAYGRLDIIVNNAAATDIAGAGKADSHVADLPTEVWEQTFRVAAHGTFWMSKYAIPHMRRAGGGSIVNITAASSTRAITGRPSYQASKGAVNALTRQIAIDYAAENIRCNAVVVGFINTGEAGMRMLLANEGFIREVRRTIPTPRLGDPRDIANAVLFFASDEAAYVTGTMLPVDGGLTARLGVPDTSNVDVLKPS
ncbi:MAG: short-chain dehydrogenase [Alphaproteobacteria bacterium HGW-Alphaproteobacteria-16]|nr:MAG: short-chain dehydrogenase [Alphaproteobacteria bacterium HGW-Alphaproteobacteria-16]